MIPAPGDDWVRLDPRKLLLDPIRTVGQAIVPLVIALVGLSRGGGPPGWLLPVAVVAPLVLGTLPWLTTHYRLTETHLQVRRGLLNRTTSTASLDRVRSVDLEAGPVHRLLGLQKVEVGTGVDDERITLDALAVTDAAALRGALLRRSPSAPEAEADGVEPTGPAAPAGTDDAHSTTLARIDWSWLRFAPFSLTRLVVVAGGLGALSQVVDQLPIWDRDTVRSAWELVGELTLLLVVPFLAVGLLVAWLVISIGGYVVQWWRFQLVREHGSLRVTHGLLTTRSITVEEAKVRGVELTEPVLMRLVGGAELATLATGVEDGVTSVLPACPRAVAVDVGAAVLDVRPPLTTALRPHGPLARRRSWWRHVRRGLFPAGALAVANLWWQLPWTWVVALAAVLAVIGLAVGEAAYRNLGHALVDDHLVAGASELARVRTVLETEGIIGWVVAQSWWQRRIGLADLTATTAAGHERVLVRDVRLEVAVALADRATPGLLADFRQPA